MTGEQLSQWYRITLSPEQRSFGFGDIIQAEMAEIWLASGMHPDVAVWREELSDITRLYFSPEATRFAATLLMRFGAEPCSEPTINSMTQLLGNPDDFDS
ncbi:MAG: hypothetical protein D6B25_16130 [Desulfobulbaceae bacterium]|nr:MAG: hypothetical protein D6B25_16130 [Desulfobulbaceae bacterium]